jgi:hypothetical protein
MAAVAAAAALAHAGVAHPADAPATAAFQVAQMARPSQSPPPAGSDHDGHHPGQAPGAAPSPGPAGQGMMGGGMMQMMQTMHMMGMMGQGGSGAMGPGMMERMRGMQAGMMTEHVEGRIAFLRAELKVTAAQASAWDKFADALRANARKLSEHAAGHAPGSPPALPDRVEHEEHRLAARLEGFRAIRAALAPLYAAFSDEQKKLAERLVPHHVGLAPAMGMM